MREEKLETTSAYQYWYCIAENFREFHGFVGICESFLCEICWHGIRWRDKREQSANVFSTKIIFFTNSPKFSPLRVSRYTLGQQSLDPNTHSSPIYSASE